MVQQIPVRHPQFDFPETLDRYWLGNNPFKTHLANSITLLFPDVEQYFIRTIKREQRYLPGGELRQAAAAFVGQEAQHATAHAQFWQNLRQQGFQFDRYRQRLQFVLKERVEKHLGRLLNLAVVAGMEHMTQSLAELALEQAYFSAAEPDLQRLFEWHAAEELEHKTVAYDVLKNATNSYWIRVLGLLIAYGVVLSGIFSATFLLLAQDKKLRDGKVWLELLRFLFVKERFAWRLFANFIRYLRFNFHPAQRDNGWLGEQIMQRYGAEIPKIFDRSFSV